MFRLDVQPEELHVQARSPRKRDCRPYADSIDVSVAPPAPNSRGERANRVRESPYDRAFSTRPWLTGPPWGAGTPAPAPGAWPGYMAYNHVSGAIGGEHEGLPGEHPG